MTSGSIFFYQNWLNFLLALWLRFLLTKALGLSDRKGHLPSVFSGGQQQRAAIARALANDPQIVLCDEPTGNLDKKTGEEVISLLHEVNKKYNKTVVIVTHDESIASGADRIVRIEDGEIKS